MNHVDETINALHYVACRDSFGNITLWDDEVRVATLPASFPIDLVVHVARAYENGETAGAVAGRADKTSEIRRALGL